MVFQVSCGWNWIYWLAWQRALHHDTFQRNALTFRCPISPGMFGGILTWRNGLKNCTLGSECFKVLAPPIILWMAKRGVKLVPDFVLLRMSFSLKAFDPLGTDAEFSVFFHAIALGKSFNRLCVYVCLCVSRSLFLMRKRIECFFADRLNSLYTCPHPEYNQKYLPLPSLVCGLSHVRLCDPDCDPPGSSVRDLPGQNTGVGFRHFLLQGNFLTQGSNLWLLCLVH